MLGIRIIWSPASMKDSTQKLHFPCKDRRCLYDTETYLKLIIHQNLSGCCWHLPSSPICSLLCSWDPLKVLLPNQINPSQQIHSSKMRRPVNLSELLMKTGADQTRLLNRALHRRGVLITRSDIWNYAVWTRSVKCFTFQLGEKCLTTTIGVFIRKI